MNTNKTIENIDDWHIEPTVQAHQFDIIYHNNGVYMKIKKKKGKFKSACTSNTRKSEYKSRGRRKAFNKGGIPVLVNRV